MPLDELSFYNLYWNSETKRFDLIFVKPTCYFNYLISKKDGNSEEFNLDMDAETLKLSLKDFGWEHMIDGLPQMVSTDNESAKQFKLVFPRWAAKEDLTYEDIAEGVNSLNSSFLKDREPYKAIRKAVKSDISKDSIPWKTDEVMKKLSSYLPISHLSKREQFTINYMLLDLLGNNSDKLPKPTDNVQNILVDSSHASNARQCDFFVTSDKALIAKTGSLYANFDITTQIITPSKFIDTIKPLMYIPKKGVCLFDDAVELINKSKQIYSIPASENNPFEVIAYELPVFYFNYYNCVERRINTEINCIELRFIRKIYDFTIKIEPYRLIDRVADFFGINDEVLFKEKKKKIETSEEHFEWRQGKDRILLYRDILVMTPVILYYSRSIEEK